MPQETAVKKNNKEYLLEFNKIFARAEQKTLDKKNKKDIEETKEFLKFWHECNEQQFIALGVKDNGKYKQNMCKLNTLIENIELYLNSKVDFYTSLHLFSYPKRAVDKAYKINGIVLDLDYLHPINNKSSKREIELFEKYKWYDPQLIVDNFYNKYIKTNKIPMPTSLIWTGRGLSVWFKVKNQNAKYKQKIYNRIYSYFLELLEEDRIDGSCRDLSRIMRPANSYNSSSKSQTNFVYLNQKNVWDNFEELFLDLNEQEYKKYQAEIEQNIIEFNRVAEEIKQRQLLLQEKDNKKKNEVNFIQKSNRKINRSEYEHICYKKTKDIETLVRLRGSKTDFEGYRSILLLYYACNYMYATQGDTTQMIEQLEKLNKIVGQEEKEIEGVIYSAEKSYKEYTHSIVRLKNEYKLKGYHYSNKTIINLFKITDLEMAYLSNIKITEDKERYNNIKRMEWRRKNGKKGAEITKSKTEELTELREKIKTLKDKGLKNKDICIELDLPLSTLKRHITYLKKQGLLE